MLNAILVVAVLVGLNGVFVAAEFSAVAARRSRIRHLAEQGAGSAKLLLGVLTDPLRLDRYISACQLGITTTSLALGAYGQYVIAAALAPQLVALGAGQEVAAQSLSVVIVLTGLSILQIVLAEQVPKSTALHRPNRIALFTIWPLLWAQRLLAPLILVLYGLSQLVLRLMGVKRVVVYGHVHSRQEIDLLIDHSERGGVLQEGQHQRLQHALELEVMTANDLMVPRPKITAIDIQTPGDAVLQTVLAGRHTRLPVYRDDIDNIVGILHTRDLAGAMVTDGGREGWRQLVRPVLFVSEGMTLDRLLTRLRERQTQQAVVMDEFGGVAGLVTLEDVLTHVFGEVEDEFSDQVAQPERLADGRVRLPGSLRLDEVPDFLGTSWNGTAKTVGGHVTEVLGHLPVAGETLTLQGVTVEIETVENHVVMSVLVGEREAAGDG
ncbi:MAG: hemolysin family protein [Planctomycetota bacterium]|jgi:CBS domain containing-hemolysin-like protein